MPNAATLVANRKGQSGLWRFSISGDYPILLVQMNTTEDLTLVQQALQAHTYWRKRGIEIDLVILNQQGTTYGQELRGQLQRVLVRQNSEDWFNRRGGIFTLYVDQLSEADRVLLETAARVRARRGTRITRAAVAGAAQNRDATADLYCHAGVLQRRKSPRHLRAPAIWSLTTDWAGLARTDVSMSFTLSRIRWTPAPWINVIANPDFGFTVSETGAGYTWFGNSSENRLTPWSNDPVSDPPGEAIYLRDEETAEVWSPTPLPCRAAAPYLIRHGAGYSIFEHHSHGLASACGSLQPRKRLSRCCTCVWKTCGRSPRRITATFYAEWVLGRDARHRAAIRGLGI